MVFDNIKMLNQVTSESLEQQSKHIYDKKDRLSVHQFLGKYVVKLNCKQKNYHMRKLM